MKRGAERQLTKDSAEDSEVRSLAKNVCQITPDPFGQEVNESGIATGIEKADDSVLASRPYVSASISSPACGDVLNNLLVGYVHFLNGRLSLLHLPRQ